MIILQTDPSVSCSELRERLELYEKLDTIQGIKARRKYIKEHDAATRKNAKHGTSYVSYTGQMDWGDVADHIESFVYIVEGHVMIEISSVGDRIFVCFMQVINTDKYIKAFREVFNEMGISFKEEGPFPKRLPRHQLPLDRT
ncbi:MAG: hypothetical protein K6G03_06605 [Lachnospiraceae bacterium]|nr:hypothetical protein [Lachnospiraceae bacterium]